MVTVAVVSYNVAPLLERCLTAARGALAETGRGGEVVVVDNASSDGSAEMVAHRFPEVRLLRNSTNRGFGAACNQALEAAGDQVLFLNPDAELRPGALPALVARLESNPLAALVGPRLEYPDGRPQPSRRRFPTLPVLFVESTPLEWRRRRWRMLDRYRCADLTAEQPGAVDWLSGACLLGRTAALRQVRGFDAHFFMYFEEVDLSRRLASYGWRTWYEPAAVVVHHHSRSADQDLVAKDRSYYRSKYRYVARYWGAAVARAVRLAGGVAFAGELLAQRRRGDASAAARYGALVRWHFSADR